MPRIADHRGMLYENLTDAGCDYDLYDGKTSRLIPARLSGGECLRWS